MIASNKKTVFLLTIIFLATACNEDSVQPTTCDSLVDIDAGRFENGSSAFFSISEVSIADNCLEVTYSSSGCSGDTWEASMVDAGEILESFPVQRELKMLLRNEEDCAAVFTKTASFDLTPIQLEEYSEIILNVDGYEEQINYSYGASISAKVEIERKWSLININGGLAGTDIDFASGSIIWDFKGSQVTVTNNSSSEVYDGFPSGTYQYEFQKSQGSDMLIIDEQNLGAVTISGENLLIDQRAADGFQFFLVKI